MERDQTQIEKLLYLLAPILMIWTASCTLFCYELGKNGIGNIDWLWLAQSLLPIIIISASMLYYGHRKLKIFNRIRLDKESETYS